MDGVGQDDQHGEVDLVVVQDEDEVVLLIGWIEEELFVVEGQQRVVG